MTGSLHNQTPTQRGVHCSAGFEQSIRKGYMAVFQHCRPSRVHQWVIKDGNWYGKWKLEGIGLSRCSVMRRWRAFCGRGLDLVHARLSPVLRQTRSQYFQRAVVPELLLRIRTLLSRRQLLIRSVPRPKKWPIRLCCLLVQTEEWPVCLCCLLVLLLCHLFHKINHLKIFFIRRWSMIKPFS